MNLQLQFILGKLFVFRRKAGGGVAIEFAIVAPVFFALVFSIFDYSLFHYISMVLDRRHIETSRLVRTGEAVITGLDRSAMIDEYCSLLKAFPKCEDRISLDISSWPSFSDLADDSDPTYCQSHGDAGGRFDLGEPFEVVKVRVCYEYSFLSPPISHLLKNTDEGTRQIQAVRIFRVEPYGVSDA